jgi:hypothetical protein
VLRDLSRVGVRGKGPAIEAKLKPPGSAQRGKGVNDGSICTIKGQNSPSQQLTKEHQGVKKISSAARLRSMLSAARQRRLKPKQIKAVKAHHAPTKNTSITFTTIT